MQPALISHSPDLQKLWDEGFDLEICGGHLLVHHIPYLNSQREIKYGTIVTPLTMVTTRSGATSRPYGFFQRRSSLRYGLPTTYCYNKQ
jgi:hypothetical protein